MFNEQKYDFIIYIASWKDTRMQISQTIFMFLFILIILYRLKKYFGGTFYTGAKPNLQGYIAIVTGGGSGLGKQSVRKLATQGCKVIFGDILDSTNFSKQLNKQLKKELVQYIYLDLGDISSIKKFANQLKIEKLDFLINNAGVIGPQNLVFTKSNYQLHYGINYIGHFYLTHLLWPLLKRSSFFRIVNLSSITHRRVSGFGRKTTIQFGKYNFQNIAFDRDLAYARSKLYLALFAKALSQIIPKDKGLAVSIHPGIVLTSIVKNMFPGVKSLLLKCIYPFYWFVSKNCIEGVQTLLYVLFSDPKHIKGGEFYMDCAPSWSNPIVEKHWKKLFTDTQQILDIQFGK